ncbi:hypothetical protein GF362_00875 [Candidatus Dojkabacteria bacterium]|nr:hypothetical protein [Candidatus Dojkabacteria bacterium]
MTGCGGAVNTEVDPSETPVPDPDGIDPTATPVPTSTVEASNPDMDGDGIPDLFDLDFNGDGNLDRLPELGFLELEGEYTSFDLSNTNQDVGSPQAHFEFPFGERTIYGHVNNPHEADFMLAPEALRTRLNIFEEESGVEYDFDHIFMNFTEGQYRTGCNWCQLLEAEGFDIIQPEIVFDISGSDRDMFIFTMLKYGPRVTDDLGRIGYSFPDEAMNFNVSNLGNLWQVRGISFEDIQDLTVPELASIARSGVLYEELIENRLLENEVQRIMDEYDIEEPAAYDYEAKENLVREVVDLYFQELIDDGDYIIETDNGIYDMRNFDSDYSDVSEAAYYNAKRNLMTDSLSLPYVVSYTEAMLDGQELPMMVYQSDCEQMSKLFEEGGYYNDLRRKHGVDFPDPLFQNYIGYLDQAGLECVTDN